MFGSAHNGASAYAKVGVETGVSTASPHKLIVMLFEGALIALTTAQQHMKAGNISAKGQAISKAIMIIDGGLRPSLDKKAGGEIAANLDALYQYMSDQLLKANIKNDVSLLAEVYRLLKDLKGAWEAIGEQAAGVPAAGAAPAAVPQVTVDSLAPQSTRLMKA